MNVLTSILFDPEMASFEREDGKLSKVGKAVQEFHTFIDRNRVFIPNYGERYHNGERISTGFVESTVNQVVSRRMEKKQQLRWSRRGAHLLLQIRTRVLNGDWEDVFRRWYPAIPCVYAARFCLSLSASPIFVQSDVVRCPWYTSLT